MKDEIIRALIREQASEEAMTPHTIRLPKTLSKEIEEFCGQTGIRKATVWRKCVILGWSQINK